MKYIVGIDEVGRGPIAGPVAVGVFLCEAGFFDNLEIDLPLRDSKKLTKKQRDKWFKFFKEMKSQKKCNFDISFVSSEMIDKFGIQKCIQKALNKSLAKITTPDVLFMRSLDEGGKGARPSQKEHLALFNIFLDGGLKAPEEYVNQESIIKGDESHKVISCASIVAKVSRDKIMYQYSLEYPEYGFEKHVGYGTKAHYEAIKKHGPTPIHRKTFIH